MLKVPADVASDPRFAPALELCEDVLLTTAEVAKHLRMTPDHLRVLRHQGKGPEYLKFQHGGVLYRMSAVLGYELAARRVPTKSRK